MPSRFRSPAATAIGVVTRPTGDAVLGLNLPRPSPRRTVRLFAWKFAETMSRSPSTLKSAAATNRGEVPVVMGDPAACERGCIGAVQVPDLHASLAVQAFASLQGAPSSGVTGILAKSSSFGPTTETRVKTPTNAPVLPSYRRTSLVPAEVT